MRVLYLDLGMGAAGDMLAAALYELLTDRQKEEYLDKISHLELDGVTVRAEAAEKCGIAGTHMAVLVEGKEETDLPETSFGEIPGAGSHVCEGGSHDHAHGHSHSSLSHVSQTIRNLAVPKPVKEDALAVYDLLAGAESLAHHTTVDKIHFHEVGEKDAIVDIVSVCLLMHMLKPDCVIASPAATGSGTVTCAHGILPVPAPATVNILQEKKIPCFAGEMQGELLTPTGAAMIGHFAGRFGSMPSMVIEKTGYGMGKKDFPQANCVRAMIGEYTSQQEGLRDVVSELSCNLDDMTPEDIGFARGRIFAAGALDVFTVPIGMKKERPGVMLNVLCHEDRKADVLKAIFRYTTTLGVREKICGRYIMRSESTDVDLDGHTVKVKISEGYGARRIKPEFDQIAEIALKEGLPTAAVRRKAARSAEDQR